MRRLLIVLLLVSAAAAAAHGAGEFVAEGVSLGSTVIRFTPTTIDTVFQGTIIFAGNLWLEAQSCSFTASGVSHGEGKTDSMTLVTDLWILFEATGKLDDGRPANARGGIAVHGDQVDFVTMSLGSGPGTFFAIIDLPDETLWIAGTLESTASGKPVAPDDPTTMQVDGGGSFDLKGDVIAQDGDLIGVLPWDVEIWPSKLHEELLTLLTGVEEGPGEESAESP